MKRENVQSHVISTLDLIYIDTNEENDFNQIHNSLPEPIQSLIRPKKFLDILESNLNQIIAHGLNISLKLLPPDVLFLITQFAGHDTIFTLLGGQALSLFTVAPLNENYNEYKAELDNQTDNAIRLINSRRPVTLFATNVHNSNNTANRLALGHLSNTPTPAP